MPAEQSSSSALENLSEETRSFPPSAEFAAAAVVGADVYEEAAADRLQFWAEQARTLDWETPFTTVLDDPFPHWAR